MFFTRPTLSYEDWIAVSKGANHVEFEWIGIDDLGQIGIFCSVGIGYIPPKVFSSYENYIALDNFLNDRAKSGTAQIVSIESGNKDFWRDWAQKGLFAYDYYDIHRVNRFERYDLVAIPGMPLSIETTPEVTTFERVIPRFNLTFEDNISMAKLKETEL